MEDPAEQVDVPESEPTSSSVVRERPILDSLATAHTTAFALQESTSEKQWRSIVDQIILSQRVINSLQRRGSLPRQGEVSVRVVPVNGDNEHSSRHSADQNMDDLPREQVAQNLSERRPSSVNSELSLLATRLEAKFEANAVDGMVRQRLRHDY